MSLMSSLSRYVFHPLWDLKDRRSRLRILRELEKTQWWTLADLQARQSERLNQILRYAGSHSPYYRRMFGECGFNPQNFSLSDFQALPLLTKSIIRSSTDEMLSEEFPRESLGPPACRWLRISTRNGSARVRPTRCGRMSGPVGTTA
jgi:hypothetical protein